MTIPASIFAALDTASGFWTRFHCRVHLRDKLIGGVPLKPDLIEGWLRKNMGLERAEEVRLQMVRTLIELGAEVDAKETDIDKIMVASQALAAKTETTGFKIDSTSGLYIEGRQVKAMLKESINCLFAGDTVVAVDDDGKKKKKRAGWGPTNKGPRAFSAEHVFIAEDHIALGLSEPTGLEFTVGHISGPDGPRSTIGYHQYVLQPVLEWTVMLDPIGHAAITEDRWAKIWLHAQENGLGAMRSQGYGRFNVVAWDRLNGRPQ